MPLEVGKAESGVFFLHHGRRVAAVRYVCAVVCSKLQIEYDIFRSSRVLLEKNLKGNFQEMYPKSFELFLVPIC